MMPYIIKLKVSKLHYATANRFGTARQKPVGGGGGGTLLPLESLNRIKQSQTQKDTVHFKRRRIMIYVLIEAIKFG